MKNGIPSAMGSRFFCLQSEQHNAGKEILGILSRTVVDGASIKNNYCTSVRSPQVKHILMPFIIQIFCVFRKFGSFFQMIIVNRNCRLSLSDTFSAGKHKIIMFTKIFDHDSDSNISVMNEIIR